jgi:hypothetical protein
MEKKVKIDVVIIGSIPHSQQTKTGEICTYRAERRKNEWEER